MPNEVLLFKLRSTVEGLSQGIAAAKKELSGLGVAYKEEEQSRKAAEKAVTDSAKSEAAAVKNAAAEESVARKQAAADSKKASEATAAAAILSLGLSHAPNGRTGDDRRAPALAGPSVADHPGPPCREGLVAVRRGDGRAALGGGAATAARRVLEPCVVTRTVS